MKQVAREFAISAHKDQLYGDLPYVTHLDAVAEIVSKYGDQAVTIAYLHDAVEDTAVSNNDIESVFGKYIADCVAIVTDEPGHNRKERKSKTYKKMSRISGDLQLALVVKAADRMANLSACIREGNTRFLHMYKREHSLFKTAAYRKNLCEDIWLVIDRIVLNN